MPTSSRFISLGGIFRLILFGFAVLLFWNLAQEVTWENTQGLIQKAGWLLALVPIPYFVTSFFDTWGWKVVIDALGKRVTLWRLFTIRLSTEAMLISIPAGVAIAETAKPILVTRYFDIDYSVSVASVVVKKCLLGVAHSLYIGCCVWIGFAAILSVSQVMLGNGLLAWIMIGMAVAMFFLFTLSLGILFNGSVSMGLHRWLMTIPFEPLKKKLLSLEAEFRETDRHLQRYKGGTAGMITLSIGLFLIGWIFEAVETITILWVLGATFEIQSILSIEVTLSLLRSLVFFIPAGAGFQDAGYISAFSALQFQDAVSLGVAFLIIKRSKELFCVLIGYATLFFQGSSVRQILNTKESQGSIPQTKEGNGMPI